jgi:hypothetical protein
VTGKKIGKVSLARRMRLAITLDLGTFALLDVLCEVLKKTRDEVVTDGLRCLFATVPRPGD